MGKTQWISCTMFPGTQWFGGSEQEPAKSAISKPGSEKDVALVAKGDRTNRGDELIKSY